MQDRVKLEEREEDRDSRKRVAELCKERDSKRKTAGTERSIEAGRDRLTAEGSWERHGNG